MWDFWLNVAAQVVATMISAGFGALFVARGSVSKWLILRTVSRLDERIRDRYRDEWLAALATSSWWRGLRFACGLWLHAEAVSAAAISPAARKSRAPSTSRRRSPHTEFEDKAHEARFQRFLEKLHAKELERLHERKDYRVVKAFLINFIVFVGVALPLFWVISDLTTKQQTLSNVAFAVLEMCMAVVNFQLFVRRLWVRRRMR